MLLSLLLLPPSPLLFPLLPLVLLMLLVLLLLLPLLLPLLLLHHLTRVMAMTIVSALNAWPGPAGQWSVDLALVAVDPRRGMTCACIAAVAPRRLRWSSIHIL